MNKKKAIKIATASAIAASGFVAVAPAQAAVKTTNVNTVVNTAISKMAAAYDGYHKPGLQGKIPPTAKIRQLTTNAEAAYDAAVAAIAKDGGTKSQKAAFTKKLNAKKYLLTRAQGYVKAIDVNLNAAKKALDKAVASGKAKDVKAAEAALVKTAATFEKAVKAVYGPSTRKALVAKYHAPALAKAATVKDELTVYNAYKEIENGKLIDTNLERAGEIIAATKATVDKLAAGDKRDTKLVKNLLDAVAKNDAKYYEKAGVIGKVDKITAINATTVELAYKEAVKDVASIKYSIEGLTVTNAAVKQTDSKTVVLTTSTQEGAKEYTVKSGTVKVGTFKGISAITPSAVNIVSNSQQAVVGKNVTVKAQVTVAAGQSKAGIPVTFNISAGDKKFNKDHVVEVYTNADGIAEYSYSQYAGGEDSVTAYATGNANIRDTSGKVYWGVDSRLKIESGDAKGYSLVNGEKKVYKVTSKYESGAIKPNTTLYVAFKENVNVEPNNVTRGVTVTDAIGDKIPYQLTTGGTQYVQITTNAKGEATFTLTGDNASVTPIVYENTVGSSIAPTLEATELQAVGEKVTFAAGSFIGLKVEAQGSKNAAVDGGIVGNGGRDYKLTLTDNTGKVAPKGTKVFVFLDRASNKSSSSSYLLDANGNKVTGSGLVPVSISNDKGEATFTVHGSKDDYATPVVFIDRNDDNKYDAGDYKQEGEITYFVSAIPTSGELELTVNDAPITSAQAGKDKVTATFNILDQNGKFLPVDGKATFEVKNPSLNNVSVNGGKGFASDVKSTIVDVKKGVATITLEADGPVDLDISVSSSLQNIYNVSTKLTFTGNPANYVKGTVKAVDVKNKKITLADETVINVDGLTLKKFASTETYTVAQFLNNVVSVGEIVEYFTNTNTLVAYDTDALGQGTIDGAPAALKAAKESVPSNYLAVNTTDSAKAVTDALALVEGTTSEKIAKTSAINTAVKGLVAKQAITLSTVTGTVSNTNANIQNGKLEVKLTSSPAIAGFDVKDSVATSTANVATVATAPNGELTITVKDKATSAAIDLSKTENQSDVYTITTKLSGTDKLDTAVVITIKYDSVSKTWVSTLK